jgi:hypothetical protein
MTFTSDSVFGGFTICQTTVGSDMTVFANSLGVSLNIGDIGTGCSPDSIGRDVSVIDNFVQATTGNGAIDIGNNRIGRDLVLQFNVSLNYIEVADNTVGRDANCSGPNFPSPSKDGAEDGPNHVGRSDTCD